MANHSDSEFKRCKPAKFIMLEFILLVVAIFVFVIVSFFAYRIFNDVNQDFQQDPTLSNESKLLMQSHETRFPKVFDGLIILFFAFSWLLLLVALYMADAHPIFLIVAFVLIIFMIILCMIFGNAYEELVSEDGLTGVSASFPMTNFIMSNMLIVSILIAFSGIVAYFGKKWVG